MRRTLVPAVLSVLLLAACTLFKPGLMLSDIPHITKEDLLKITSDPNVTILDVRVGQDWYESTEKIKGAVRETPGEFSKWIPRYARDRHYVLYCE